MSMLNEAPQGETGIVGPGKKQAIISIILDCISMFFCFLLPLNGDGYLYAVISGIIGLVFARKAKKEGATSILGKASLIFSLLCLILGVIMLIGFCNAYIKANMPA